MTDLQMKSNSKKKSKQNVKIKEIFLSNNDVDKILNNEIYIKSMNEIIESYDNLEILNSFLWPTLANPFLPSFSRRTSVNSMGMEQLTTTQEVFNSMMTSYANTILCGISRNHLPTTKLSKRKKAKLKFIFNCKSKFSMEYLKNDIDNKHGYLLNRSDPINLGKCYKENRISTSVNIRKLLRISETNHYHGKKVPESFKDDIKVVINNMKLPNKYYYVQSNSVEIKNVEFFDDGNSYITIDRVGRTEIFKYSNINGLYKKNKTIAYSNNLIVEDMLISQKKKIVYISQYPGHIHSIDLEDLNQNYLVNNLIIYIPDFSNSNVIKKICFKDQDESFLICGSADGNVYGYDVNKLQLAFKVKSHYSVKDVCMLSKDNSNVFVSAGRNYLNVFDSRILKTNSELCSPIAIITDTNMIFNHVASRGDGNYVVVSCNEDKIKVYDVRYANKYIFDNGDDSIPEGLANIGGIEMNKIPEFSGICKSKFSPPHTGSRYIYTGCYDGNVVIFDLYTGLKIKTIWCKGLKRTSALDWHPFKNEIVAGGFYGKVAYITDEKHIKSAKKCSNYSTVITPCVTTH
ncbi:WD40 repeat and WD40/YVTN repeat-like-containing domain and WD40-repeat-containing domain-containing protein [Strongyloides ratti]|uniref:WD40 repeat and WD40/YVTN repeat-like-containing domain and WD40-repeat-containing domain-containing protein n=1 Tax=Strongyloides ratti TaxID=34506 RepID=A0A090MXB9_STRRB|nr:WD40 repeat and WD40/YVTN repeat-like-containing domain and WD40-repeat-containing domain-containing protein [Strongyloides ratti]CEF65164.1 WD40 repeat and WD40/YVTN repeat-like-containing domain and WD40-repeat-containing domain-containing protein [Strongyloides ratti]